MNPNLAIIEVDSVKLYPSINLSAHIPTDNVEINKKKTITINDKNSNKKSICIQSSKSLPSIIRTINLNSNEEYSSRKKNLGSYMKVFDGEMNTSYQMNPNMAIEEKLSKLNSSDRLDKIRRLRNFKMGTAPRIKDMKFRDYVRNILLDEISEKAALSGVDNSENKSLKSLTSQEIVNEFISGGTTYDQFDDDILLDGNSKESDSNSLFVKKVEIIQQNSSKELDDELSADSHMPSRPVSRSSNLNLYRVINPGPNSPQSAGGAGDYNNSDPPLYAPDQKLKNERERQLIASRDSSTANVLAETVLLSTEFPFRKHGEDHFDDKPKTPSSPFDSKAQRIKQLLKDLKISRDSSPDRGGGGGGGGGSNANSPTHAGSRQHIGASINPSAGQHSINCNECIRPALLWCPECSAAFCPVCWVKITHHEFIKAPYVWENFQLNNSLHNYTGSNHHLNTMNNLSYSVDHAPVVRKPTTHQMDLHVINTLEMQSNSIYSDGGRVGSVITPSVFLDSNGQLRRNNKDTAPMQQGDLNANININDLSQKSVIRNPDDHHGSTEQNHAEEDEDKIDLENYKLKENVSLTNSLLATMALHSHHMAKTKKDAMQKCVHEVDSSDWAKFSLAGNIPPVNLNKLTDEQIERNRILKNYRKANKPKNLLLDPINDPKITKIPSIDDDLNQDQILDISVLENELRLTPPSSPPGNVNSMVAGLYNDSIAGEMSEIIFEENKLGVNLKAKENVIVIDSHKKRANKAISKSTPSLMHTGWRGVGLGASYRPPVNSEPIVGITSEIELSLPPPETKRNITMFNGAAVYTASDVSIASTTVSDVPPAETMDVYKANEIKRKKAFKAKQRQMAKAAAADQVLDKLNPLLLDIYGINYTKIPWFKDATRKPAPTYNNLPPSLPIDPVKLTKLINK